MQRFRMGRLVAVFAVLAAACPLGPLRADTVAQVGSGLNAPAAKRWILTPAQAAAARGRCVSGETWTFLPNRKLKIDRCVLARWVTSNFDYELRQQNDIDVTIVLRGTNAPFTNERRVRILNNGRNLLIRDLPDGKGQAQQDMLFTRDGRAPR